MAKQNKIVSEHKKVYLNRVLGYIFFHNKLHPMDIDVPEIEAFLSHLTIKSNVA